jgi:hypothetical protein
VWVTSIVSIPAEPPASSKRRVSALEDRDDVQGDFIGEACAQMLLPDDRPAHDRDVAAVESISRLLERSFDFRPSTTNRHRPPGRRRAGVRDDDQREPLVRQGPVRTPFRIDRS